MPLEELPPNEPNFGLVVALATAALLILFVVGYITLDWDGKRLVPHDFSKHNTSNLHHPIQQEARLS